MILVAPSGGANVGSVCRAIKNMEAGRLVLVGGSFADADARRMAVHARDVFDARLRVDTLPEALEGCGLIVGTTTRTGAYRSRAEPIRSVARDIVRHHATLDDSIDPVPGCEDGLDGGGNVNRRRPVALVFGPEDRGLSNSDIASCHRLAYIPASPEYRSLNLAQAALVCLYEVWMARLESKGSDGKPLERPGERVEPADARDIETMFVDLEAAFLSIGFLSEQNPGHVMLALRALLARAGMDERELAILRGLARQINWFGKGGYEIAQAKADAGTKLR